MPLLITQLVFCFILNKKVGSGLRWSWNFQPLFYNYKKVEKTQYWCKIFVSIGTYVTGILNYTHYGNNWLGGLDGGWGLADSLYEKLNAKRGVKTTGSPQRFLNFFLMIFSSTTVFCIISKWIRKASRSCSHLPIDLAFLVTGAETDWFWQNGGTGCCFPRLPGWLLLLRNNTRKSWKS